MTFKIPWLIGYLVLFVFIDILLTVPVRAQHAAAPTEDGTWYYEIGGAQPVSAPANARVTSANIGASAEIGLGYSCLKFDPVVAVSNTLNNIGRGVDDMMAAMTDAATGAVAALPAMVLQRANPGLYDLFQTALVKAETTVNLATQSCEQMEAEIAQGKNPYQDLVMLSKGYDWKAQMGLAGNDPVSAKNAVEASNGGNGLPWIGGRSGGAGQDPLALTGDLTQAGFNLHMNRAVADTATVMSTDDARITQIWSSPDEARQWITDVVGEHVVSICDGCDRTTTPGTGLQTKLMEEVDTVRPVMYQLIEGDLPLTLENLAKISPPGIAVTRQVIESIRGMAEGEKTLIAERLISEIGTSRVLEKAFYARRLLQTGRQVPEVLAIEIAQNHADAAIQAIDAEIERVLFETRIRKELTSNTVLTLLRYSSARRNASLRVTEQKTVDPSPLQDGKVSAP